MKCVDFLKSGTLSGIDSGSTALKMARECNLVAALFPAAFAGSCVVLAGAVGQKLLTQLVCASAAGFGRGRQMSEVTGFSIKLVVEHLVSHGRLE